MNTLYVHLDTTSNAVLTKGITHRDFIQHIVHQPQNLLLLDPASEVGKYENHTGFKIVKSNEQVLQLLHQVNRTQRSLKWIDFADIAMVRELTPLEISELLYFGHMNSHLHSPFFYKLQNNFAYFDIGEELSRVYYRYLDEFYRVLTNKIYDLTTSTINNRRSFFRKEIPITHLNPEIISQLKNIWQEGVAVNFPPFEEQQTTYDLPIYLLEDALWKLKSNTFQNEERLATLTYDLTNQQWTLQHQDQLFASIN